MRLREGGERAVSSSPSFSLPRAARFDRSFRDRKPPGAIQLRFLGQLHATRGLGNIFGGVLLAQRNENGGHLKPLMTGYTIDVITTD